MTDLLKELEAVALLAEKATPGEWRAWDDLDGDYAKVEGSPDGPNIANTGRLGWPEAKDNAAYITALSNLFRTHHAEIAEALKDKVRMDWLCSDEVHWIEIQSNPRGDYVYVGTDDRTPLRRKIDAATQEGEG